VIHVIEPTLSSEAGHCSSLVGALSQANIAKNPMQLWMDRSASMKFDSAIEPRRHFIRWLRRPQSFLLFRRLLRQPGKIFVSTASLTDLRLFALAAREPVPPLKAYFYFHWMKPSASKMRRLKHIASSQPNITIFGSTPTVVHVFQEAGFARAQVIPYPISVRRAGATAHTPEFNHLLFAGAARQDKGFRHIVDLVEYLHARRASIRIKVQVSGAHFGKYDAETLADIKRLNAIQYPYLECLTETLTVTEYEALFVNAIALQLYRRADFLDRISGVTLDAFSGGCPVVTTAQTWMARMVDRFDAGLATAETTPAHIVTQIEQIIGHYHRYATNAASAGRILQQEHCASALYEALTHD